MFFGHEVVGFFVGNSNEVYAAQGLPFADEAPFFVGFVDGDGETVGWSHQCFAHREEAVEAASLLGLHEASH